MGLSAAAGVVGATSWTLVTYQKLPAVDRIPQTKMTYSTQMNIGGNLPVKLLNKLIPSRLMYLDRVRLHFDKTTDIDKTGRDDFVQSIKDYEGRYDDEECLEITNALASLVRILVVKARYLNFALNFCLSQIAITGSGDKL